jgi:putative hydrolase of HD superfamily
MKRIAELILEACFLKHLPRSGYQYLGTGKESVAEHVYVATMIAYVLAELEPEADSHRLITMCLFHDLPEARTGDLNYVQKQYVTADETTSLNHTLDGIPFGPKIGKLIREFNENQTLESRLAHDADQLSLLIDLKSLEDVGYKTPRSWLPHVEKRLKTAPARQLAQTLLNEDWDGWWRKIFC